MLPTGRVRPQRHMRVSVLLSRCVGCHVGNCKVKLVTFVFIVGWLVALKRHDEPLGRRHVESSRSVWTDLCAQRNSVHGCWLGCICCCCCKCCFLVCGLAIWGLLDRRSCGRASLLVHIGMSDSAKWGVVRTFKIIPFPKSDTMPRV